MANVNTAVTEIVPQAGSNMQGWKLGFLESTAKVAQNDTVTITNAREVLHIDARIVADGSAEDHTISTNVITLTSVTTGNVRGLVLYK